MKLPGIDKRGIRFHAKWTHEFIRDFGWKEYLRVVWRDAWIYRFKNWRCWFGHILGEAQWSYDPAESALGYDGWRYCERASCEYCEPVL